MIFVIHTKKNNFKNIEIMWKCGNVEMWEYENMGM